MTMESPLLLVEVMADVALLLLTGARVLVEIFEVTVEPSALVVVTATVVGTEVLEATC